MHRSFPAKGLRDRPGWGSPQIITNNLEQLRNGGPFIQQQLETPVGAWEGEAASQMTFLWPCKTGIC